MVHVSRGTTRAVILQISTPMLLVLRLRGRMKCSDLVQLAFGSVQKNGKRSANVTSGSQLHWANLQLHIALILSMIGIIRFLSSSHWDLRILWARQIHPLILMALRRLAPPGTQQMTGIVHRRLLQALPLRKFARAGSLARASLCQPYGQAPTVFWPLTAAE